MDYSEIVEFGNKNFSIRKTKKFQPHLQHIITIPDYPVQALLLRLILLSYKFSVNLSYSLLSRNVFL